MIPKSMSRTLIRGGYRLSDKIMPRKNLLPGAARLE
jgi:hypothetical protein